MRILGMLPPLYKFRSIDEDNPDKCRTLESLRESYLHFSNPTSFNDPFEFRAFLDYSDRKLKRQDLERRVANLYHHLTYDQRRNLAAKLMVDKGFRKGLAEAEFLPQELVQTVLLYCATSTRDSILLWSHYASNHRGICIELDAGKDRILSNAQAVSYDPAYPTVDVFNWDTKETKQSILYRKSPEWEYEQEYRALFGVGNPTGKKHIVSPSTFVSITFGARISERSRDLVIEATRKKLKHVRFEQARLGHRTFSLDFDPFLTGRESN